MSLTLKETEDLLKLMSSYEVDSFSFGELHVKFPPRIPTSTPLTLDDNKAALTSLKESLAAINASEQEDLLWSAAP